VDILDMRTVLIRYVISNVLCILVIATLWKQGRKVFVGPGFWLADYILQFLALLLIVLRGTLPDTVSIMGGTPLILGGTLLMYTGLERHLGKTSRQRYNVTLWIISIFVQAYFAFVRPSMLARNLNLSLGLLLICCQIAWLMLRRVEADMRSTTRVVGVIFVIFCLVSVFRVFVDLALPLENDLFKMGLYDTLVIVTYQILFICLTFALFLMVNRRLVAELRTDIGNRIRTEEALFRSEQKYSIAFHNIPDALVITSMQDGKIIEANEHFFQLAGCTKEETSGKTTLDLGLWDNVPDRNRLVELLEQQGQVKDFETCFRNKSGTLIPSLVSSEIINLPEGKCILNVIHDITEHKRQDDEILAAEAELRRLLTEGDLSRRVLLSLIEDQKAAEDEIRKFNADLEERITQRTQELSDLYNNSPCGYHSLDEEGLVVRINDTELKWLGYTREEVVGRIKFTDLLTAECVQTFRNNFPVFKERGWLTDLELDVLRKDGSIFPILVNASAIYDQDGHFRMSRSTIVDHTERKRAESALRASQARLEAANKELEAFSYSVSHDLRAPLRGIDGWSLALVEDFQDQLSETALKYLHRVRSEAQRMGVLIDDLLQLSRVTRADMEQEKVDLTCLALTIIERLQAAQPGRKVEISVQPGLIAHGDATLLEVLLTNLLDNAWKFTGRRSLAQIEFGLCKEAVTPTFFVRDNGVGFDMTYANKLFGVFQRMHKPNDFPGTGIGLATVQRIAQRHGGWVWAEAQVDQGAAFYFTLEEAA
jgi:PAS domain S-box-containing protein